MYEIETYGACYKLLSDMFNVQPDETVCITYDTESYEEVALATASAAITLGAKPLLMKIAAPLGVCKAADKDIPWKSMFGALSNADVWVEYNTKVLCNSKLFEDVTRTNKDLRYINLVGAGPSMMVRLIGRTDIKLLAEFNHRVSEATAAAKVIRMTTPLGTDITMENVPGRPIDSEDGLIGKGQVKMMVGQIAWTPDHAKTNGIIVMDEFLHGFPIIDQPVKCTIEKGYITKIEGGSTAKAWSEWMHSFNDPEMMRIAHATYGVHPAARLGADIDIVENERIWGTTLWGFGNITDSLIPDVKGGMPAACHTDGLCPCSTVYLDGKLFFKDGVVVGPTAEIVELARKLGK